jgi:glycosyltransferase involved in cell wall biosynthesis
MIINLPIEPLEERYSTQWTAWFDQAFIEHGIQASTVYPSPLTDCVETGAFLDVYGTNHFKCLQMSALARNFYHYGVTDSDWVLFHDLWNPGVLNLAYMRDGAGKKFRIAGCLHAGTWDQHDFLCRKNMAPWARHLEMAILMVADLVFVATEFHKELICRAFGRRVEDKIKVTGFPIHPQPSTGLFKEDNLVVFPHRLDPEKQPALFYELRDKASNYGLECIASRDVCHTKAEYYELLERAAFAVSYAQQETWGIAMQEAVFAGCVPIVPDRLSYREMYPALFRVSDPSEVLPRILQFKGHGSNVAQAALSNTSTRFAASGQNAIVSMLREMGYGC